MTTTALPPGQVITAMATNPNGGTSEFFAPGVVVAKQPAVADIVVSTFTDAPDPVAAGQDLTYTITAKNNGPAPATNVVLTDFPLPANVQFVSTSAARSTRRTTVWWRASAACPSGARRRS